MANKQEISYRTAISEIDEIVAKLNMGNLDIDTVSQDVKRALELIALCKEKLTKSEEEVRKIIEE